MRTDPEPPAIGEPLPLNLTALPTTFNEDQIYAVFDRFNLLPKGEFETTAAFQARSATVHAVERTFSFWVHDPVVRYDADRERLKVSIPSQSCSWVDVRPNCNLQSLTVREIVANETPYPASNAFGATFMVKVTTRIRFGVIVPRLPGVFLDLDLPASAEQALDWKDSLGVLLTVGPGEGITKNRTIEGSERHSATFSDPEDRSTTYRYLDIPVVATWVVNRKTGAVVAKFEGLPSQSAVR